MFTAERIATAGTIATADTIAVTAAAPAGDVPSVIHYGTRVHAMRTADGPRTARIHHPADARPGAPLVVVLHSATVSALEMEASTAGAHQLDL